MVHHRSSFEVHACLRIDQRYLQFYEGSGPDHSIAIIRFAILCTCSGIIFLRFRILLSQLSLSIFQVSCNLFCRHYCVPDGINYLFPTNIIHLVDCNFLSAAPLSIELRRSYRPTWLVSGMCILPI